MGGKRKKVSFYKEVHRQFLARRDILKIKIEYKTMIFVAGRAKFSLKSRLNTTTKLQ